MPIYDEEIQAIDVLDIAGHTDVSKQIDVMKIKGCANEIVMDLVSEGSKSIYEALKDG